ncbi:MAG: hypothetical protein ACRBG0_09250 [Lewinella sp.]|uniref:hypothetical protein n=1 Tax=Lewinella sp. TaxID=2004506 RepID=UPI003D6A6B89
MNSYINRSTVVYLKLSSLGSDEDFKKLEQFFSKGIHISKENTFEITQSIANFNFYKKNFTEQLDLAISTAKKRNKPLFISHFTPFTEIESIPWLQNLVDSNLKVRFLDSPSVSEQAFPHFIFIHSKTKARPKERKVKTSKQGLHLRDKDHQALKVRKRIQKTYFKANNITAIEFLLKESKDNNYTLSELAEKMTSQKIKTSLGNSHTPKSVSRLFDKIEILEDIFTKDLSIENIDKKLSELKDRFTMSGVMERQVASTLEVAVSGARNLLSRTEELPPGTIEQQYENYFSKINNNNNKAEEKLDTVPLLWEAEPFKVLDFSEFIYLKFSLNIKKVRVRIFPALHHKERQELDEYDSADQYMDTEEGLKEIKIDIVEETTLLPGRYYLLVEADGFQPAWQVFTILGDINPLNYSREEIDPISLFDGLTG